MVYDIAGDILIGLSAMLRHEFTSITFQLFSSLSTLYQIISSVRACGSSSKVLEGFQLVYEVGGEEFTAERARRQRALLELVYICFWF